MRKPYLKIIAGCNGSGKSTYSQSYESQIIPFDFDVFNYNVLPHNYRKRIPNLYRLIKTLNNEIHASI